MTRKHTNTPPPFRKADLIDELATELKISKAEATRTIDVLVSRLSRELAAGNPVQIHGFVSMQVATRAQRNGRNPKTGVPMSVPARKVIRMKPTPLFAKSAGA